MSGEYTLALSREQYDSEEKRYLEMERPFESDGLIAFTDILQFIYKVVARLCNESKRDTIHKREAKIR